jgi:hypothetical protein
MQAGDAEAAASAGLPQRAEGEAAVTQQALFEDTEVSPIHGLRLKLERKTDLENGCCTNFAVVHIGKGSDAVELCWLWQPPRSVAEGGRELVARCPDAFSNSEN